MSFEEANAQTILMDELTRLTDQVSGFMFTDALLQDARYSTARAKLENAKRSLIEAQHAIGATPRINE